MMMQPVDSSNVAAVGYDPEKKEMAVKFKSGSTYIYSGINPAEHEALVNASSIGKRFNAQFRSRSARKL